MFLPAHLYVIGLLLWQEVEFSKSTKTLQSYIERNVSFVTTVSFLIRKYLRYSVALEGFDNKTQGSFLLHDVRASEIWGAFLWDDPDQVVTQDLLDHPPWERIHRVVSCWTIHPSDLVLLIFIRIIPQIRDLTIPATATKVNVTEKSKASSWCVYSWDINLERKRSLLIPRPSPY